MPITIYDVIIQKTMSPRKSEEGFMIKLGILGSTEAVVLRFSSKKMFLKICEISQENTCVGVSF